MLLQADPLALDALQYLGLLSKAALQLNNTYVNYHVANLFRFSTESGNRDVAGGF